MGQLWGQLAEPCWLKPIGRADLQTECGCAFLNVNARQRSAVKYGICQLTQPETAVKLCRRAAGAEFARLCRERFAKFAGAGCRDGVPIIHFCSSYPSLGRTVQ